MNDLEASLRYRKFPKEIQKIIAEDLVEAFINRVATMDRILSK